MPNIAVVTYRVKKEKVDENVQFIREVFKYLRDSGPSGVKYSSTCSEDRQTFTHIACFESKEAQAKLTESEAFKSFQKELKERCEDPPNAKFSEVLEDYNLFS